MKRIFLLVILLSAIVTSTFANVPGGHYRGGYRHSTIIINGGYGYGYYHPFGFYYGYPWYSTPAVPTKLDMQIADIRNDYADKIKSVRLDNSLTRQEKREQVKEFKRDRKMDVMNAQRNYYKL